MPAESTSPLITSVQSNSAKGRLHRPRAAGWAGKIPSADAGGQRAGNSRRHPRKMSLPVAISETQSNNVSFGPVVIRNGIAIDLAIFAQLTVVPNSRTHWHLLRACGRCGPIIFVNFSDICNDHVVRLSVRNIGGLWSHTATKVEIDEIGRCLDYMRAEADPDRDREFY